MGQILDFWLDKLDIDVSDMAFQLGKGNLEVFWFQRGRCLEQKLQSGAESLC